MKSPDGITDVNGDPVKGEVTLCGSSGDELTEVLFNVEGNQSCCYALTSLDDIITIHFSFEAGMADFVDVVVDGVLRESKLSTKSKKLFKGKIEKVCDEGRLASATSGRKMGLHLVKMQVQRRQTQKDVIVSDASLLSKVGSIELQLFQNRDSEDEIGGDRESSTSTSTAKRASNFVDFPSWFDLNSNVSAEPPQLEIGFTDASKHGKIHKERVVKPWSADYKLVCSMRFLLRSANEIKSLGNAKHSHGTLNSHDLAVKTPKMTTKNARVDSAEENLCDEKAVSVDLSPQATDIIGVQPQAEEAEEKFHEKTLVRESMVDPVLVTMDLHASGAGLTSSHSPVGIEEANSDSQYQYLTEQDLDGTPTTSLRKSAEDTDLPANVPIVLGLQGATALSDWDQRSINQSSRACSVDLDQQENEASFNFENNVIERQCSQPPEKRDQFSFDFTATRYASSESDLDTLVNITPSIYEDQVIQRLDHNANSLDIVNSGIVDPRIDLPTETPIETTIMEPEMQPKVVDKSPILSVEHPELPEDGPQLQAVPSQYPEAVKDYFRRTFSVQNFIEGISRSQIEAKLRVIAPYPDHDLIRSTNWETMLLPQEIIRQEENESRQASTVLPPQGLLPNLISESEVGPAVKDIESSKPKAKAVPVKKAGLKQTAPQKPTPPKKPGPQKGTPKKAPSASSKANKIQLPTSKRKPETSKEEPRKTPISPALRQTEIQAENARTRLMAAEKAKDDLQAKYEAALEIQREQDRIKEQIREAEKIEQENADLEAKIAAIYGNFNDTSGND